LYSNFHACLAARQVAKFCEVIPLGPKVIGAPTLNCGPIFKFCLLKIDGVTLPPVGCGLVSLGKRLRGQQPLAEIWSSEKVDFGG